MNKLIRSITPVVLVLFVSVFVCPCWAKEGDITAKVEMQGGVDQGTIFVMKASLFREDASGMKNPILENNAIRIEVPDGFNVRSETISTTNEGQHIYQIVAPINEKEYPITLIFDNQKEAPLRFGYKIKVVNPGSYYMQLAIGFGVVILLLIGLKVFCDSFIIK